MTIWSTDALLVVGGLAAVLLSLGLVHQSNQSATSQPSALEVAAAPGQRLPVLVVAAADSPADVVVGQPVADAAGGALLAVGATGLSEGMTAQLSRSRPDEVLVLGGPAGVSEATASALREYTIGPVVRLAGADRFATAAMVAQARFPNPVTHVRIMSGAATALPPPAAAGERSDMPVLFVERDSVPASTAAALRALRPRSISVAGGPAAVSDDVLEQLRVFTPGRVVRSP